MRVSDWWSPLESGVVCDEEPVWRTGQLGFGTCLAGGLGPTEQSCWDSRDAVGDSTVTCQSSIGNISIQVARNLDQSVGGVSRAPHVKTGNPKVQQKPKERSGQQRAESLGTERAHTQPCGLPQLWACFMTQLP